MALRISKPSTLALPSPDQALSARWLTQKIRTSMVDVARMPRHARQRWSHYNLGLHHLAEAIQRRARTQAAKAFAKAKRSKRK